MNNSGTSEENSIGADDAPERPPRYEQVIRWAEYIKEHPPEEWGPQQNAVVNGQIESAQAVNVNSDDKTRIREFANEVLRAEREEDERDESVE